MVVRELIFLLQQVKNQELPVVYLDYVGETQLVDGAKVTAVQGWDHNLPPREVFYLLSQGGAF
jgi:hypothetical protein